MLLVLEVIVVPQMLVIKCASLVNTAKVIPQALLVNARSWRQDFIVQLVM